MRFDQLKNFVHEHQRQIAIAVMCIEAVIAIAEAGIFALWLLSVARSGARPTWFDFSAINFASHPDVSALNANLPTYTEILTPSPTATRTETPKPTDTVTVEPTETKTPVLIKRATVRPTIVAPTMTETKDAQAPMTGGVEITDATMKDGSLRRNTLTYEDVRKIRQYLIKTGYVDQGTILNVNINSGVVALRFDTDYDGQYDIFINAINSDGTNNRESSSVVHMTGPVHTLSNRKQQPIPVSCPDGGGCYFMFFVGNIFQGGGWAGDLPVPK